jgi:diadenosine tetraphosphate (Ap4A) HIT family hydrolase
MNDCIFCKILVNISRRIRALSQCKGLSVFQSNGVVAGQEVFHFHLRLLPRYANDKSTRCLPNMAEYPDRVTLDRLAHLI